MFFYNTMNYTFVHVCCQTIFYTFRGVMARRTKKEAEETKESILESAAMVFIEKGYANASLEQIAEGANVTRGAVYWHFKNKMDIFKALHDQLYTPFADMILKDLEVDDSHPLKQLEDLCVGLILDLEKQPQKRRILTIFFLKCEYSGEMEKVLECQNERKKDSMKLFSQYFERAKKKGHLPKSTDASVLTLSLICYITGIVYEYLRNPEMFNLKENAPNFMRMFFNGI